MTSGPVTIAFFDLDKTLLRRNSGSLWLSHEFRHGKINAWQGLRALGWLIRYSTGFGDVEDGLRIAIKYLRGDREDEMRTRVRRWYEDEVRDLVRPGGRKTLDAHRAQGHRVVLLTSSSNYLSELVAKDLELDDFLCSRFEVDANGHYTGLPLGTLCYGDGKLEHAKTYADQHGADLSECTFYTDSMADLPVLEAVGHPVCIHPDPRLGRLAKSRGWPIQQWGP